MLIYLLKSGACLAILFLFYKLFLEKENMHVFKRFYLLTALLFSLIVPALVFVEYVEAPPTTHTVVQQVAADSDNVINVPAALETDVLDITPLLWGIYFLGLLFFGITFIKNLFQIFRRIRRNPKQISARFTQVLLLEKITPHTFFSYIFLNKKKFESNEIPKEVLLHEETHARQKHSLDVVFVEMLQVVFWFNPFIYLFKKAVKLNHEFLADHAVLKKDINTTTYQNTLLSYLSPDSQKKYQPKLANAINYSSIKKRFTVMKTHTSKKSFFIRSPLLLPLLAILLYGFTETIIIQKEVAKAEANSLSTEVKATPEIVAEYNNLAKKWNLFLDYNMKIVPSKKRRLEQLFKLMSAKQKSYAQPFPDFSLANKNQEGATKDQIAAYNVLGKKYNGMIRRNKYIHIKHAEVERMEYLYNLMTKDQKAAAEPFPDFPPMPDVPTPPAPMARKGGGSDFPAPPNLAYRIDQKPLSEELRKLVDNYANKRKGYRKSVAGYISNGKGNEDDIHDLYKQLLKAYNQYKVMANDEGVFAQASPAFAPKVKKGEVSAIPPPPPAPAKVEKGGTSSIPPPPPTPDQVEKYVNNIIETQEIIFEDKVIAIDGRGVIFDRFSRPKPPVPPKSPLDHVIEMAKKDAIFYHEGKEITSDKAIKILKNSTKINIDTRRSNSDRPVVRLSSKPIIIEN